MGWGFSSFNYLWFDIWCIFVSVIVNFFSMLTYKSFLNRRTLLDAIFRFFIRFFLMFFSFLFFCFNFLLRFRCLHTIGSFLWTIFLKTLNLFLLVHFYNLFICLDLYWYSSCFLLSLLMFLKSRWFIAIVLFILMYFIAFRVINFNTFQSLLDFW